MISDRDPFRMNTSKQLVNTSRACFDESGAINEEVDAYSVTRSTFECGPSSIMEVMRCYKHDTNVLWYGLWNSAKFDYEENLNGCATIKAINVFTFTLTMMDYWQGCMPIQGMALSILVTLSDVYANRLYISSERAWIDSVHKAILSMETMKYSTDNDSNKYSVELEYLLVKHDGIMTIAIKSAVIIANNACAFLSSMAYDDETRITLSDRGIPLVMYAMRLCFTESLVICNGSLALYNFVYRNKKGLLH